jgi:hypothetical protein
VPRVSKGARLYLERARYSADGEVVRKAIYVIRDGPTKRSTGFGEGEIEQAQGALAEYLTQRYKPPRDRDRDPGSIKIADVIAIYIDDVATKHARPKETAARLDKVLESFGEQTLIDVNSHYVCQENRTIYPNQPEQCQPGEIYERVIARVSMAFRPGH